MNQTAVFGDSLARGVILDERTGSYRPAKETFVSLVAKGYDLTVSNFARFGSTVSRVAAEFARRCSSIHPGDYVLFEFGGNDSDFTWSEISEAPDSLHLPHTVPEVFEREYESLVSKVKALGAKPILMNLPPIDPRKYFEFISKDKDPANILRWLGGNVEFIYRFHESYSKIIESVARRMNVPLLDVRSDFLRERDLSLLLCADGIHLNESGHARVFSAIKRQAPVFSF